MNRERAKELLPIIQAFADGNQIEYKALPRVNPTDNWDDIEFDHDLDLDQWLYRIKPEPREFFIFVPSMEAFLEKDIGPNPEDDDLFIKVREVLDE